MIAIENARIERGGFALTASLTVPKATLCAIIGPSGSGKSTLLEAVAGFLPLAAGTIRVGGQQIGTLPPAKRPVTMLFQEGNLFPHLTVTQNIGLGLGLKPSLRLGDEDSQSVERVLEETGLAGLGERRPEALSGGQRQRAAHARALLRDRPVLLLDEPFAALGPALRDEMLALIEGTVLARGIAVLMVTHTPEDARRAAALTAICMEGRIEGAHPTAALLDNPPDDLAAYLGKG